LVALDQSPGCPGTQTRGAPDARIEQPQIGGTGLITLIGAKGCLETIYVLSAPYSDVANPATEVLKRGYQAFLGEAQPRLPSADQMAPVYVGPDEIETYGELYDAFDAGSNLDDTAYDFQDARATPSASAHALSQLNLTETQVRNLRSIHPTFGSIFDLAVNFVFAAASSDASGGTINSALGVLWADPRPEWGEQDHFEFLIHELSHILLFLDEWRFQLFRSLEELTDPDNYALSAIRGVARPLDKTFHSIVVSTEVLIARDRLLGHPAEPLLHPTSPILIQGTQASIDSIRALIPRGILRPRAVDLLDLCEEALTTIDPTRISSAVAS
jgi:hypothetical protein